MDYYLYFQTPASLFKKVPGLSKASKDEPSIKEFKQISEFGKQKYDKIALDSLNLHYNQGIEIHYIYKGKYNWEVDGKKYTLYPGDVFVTCPWEKHGSPTGQLDLGVLAWIIISPTKFGKDLPLYLGNWSRIELDEQKKMDRIIKKKENHHFKNEQVGLLFDELYNEINNKALGYQVRINSIVDELFITCSRSMQLLSEEVRSMPPIYEELLTKVRHKPEYPWTVEEMAQLVGMRVTAFNEKMKNYTGYTPADFLIHVRLAKAKNLLLTTKERITDIAELCGFYSVQHLSDTFKKRVGVTPKDFRKQK